ncbi:Cof-type HAD-IIB family hydrolase [Massilioclostridium coli]|uniref:Cof-type HAD-IIB family hydrolase n=1 Tax=Massilioclostridium coli TaxID=1870991 RepID=UPI00085CDC5D|nr:Cof-type HAD-IIB family hydrolase [Massilioclostridium coli]
MKLDQYFLATDMDGTLLTSQKTISQRDREAIKHWKELGGEFTIATGRSMLSAKRYVETLDITMPVILFNGGMVYDYQQKKVLWNACLSQRYMDVVKQVKQKYPQVGIEVLGAETTYIFHPNDIVIDHVNREKLEYQMVEEKELPKEAIKVLFGVPEDLMEEFAAHMYQLEETELVFVKTHTVYFEMLPEGINKGVGLEHLSHTPQAEGKLSIAVGDFFNDMEMLQKAHLGVAVGNALPEVKQIADLVVCTNEEGAIADTMEYVINNQDNEK